MNGACFLYEKSLPLWSVVLRALILSHVMSRSRSTTSTTISSTIAEKELEWVQYFYVGVFSLSSKVTAIRCE